MIKSRSIEQEYFVEIIRSFVASAKNPPTAPDALQWKKFQQIAYRDPRCLQPLGPLIYKTNAPWDLKTEIATGAKPLRDQTLKTLEALPDLLAALEQSGIPAIVLKGPAIAFTVYSSEDLRYISDVDLLCSREDIDRACQVIEELGYSHTTEGRTEIYYEDHHFHRIYRNPDGVYVEVHWDLTVPSDFVRFDPAELFSKVRTISTEDVAFSAFRPADLLMHIVSQSLPNFDSVGRLLDVCMLIKAGALHDTNLVSSARNRNLATPLWVMLNLATHVMDDPELSTVIDALRPNLFRRTCLGSLPIRERMFGPLTVATGESRLLRVLCCPSWRYSIKRLIGFIVPSEEDLHIQMYSTGQISRGEKLQLGFTGTISVIKMLAYMIWRVASQRIHRA